MFVFVLVAGLQGSAVLAATVWKWRDAAGRVTVSDQPPPRDIPDRDILERPAPRPTVATTPGGALRPAAAPRQDSAPAAGGTASSVAPGIDPELEARRRAEQARAPAAAALPDPQALARRRENCLRARSMLASLDSGQRISRMNEKGERVVLDEATRDQEARRAREVIASDCG